MPLLGLFLESFVLKYLQDLEFKKIPSSFVLSAIHGQWTSCD